MTLCSTPSLHNFEAARISTSAFPYKTLPAFTSLHQLLKFQICGTLVFRYMDPAPIFLTLLLHLDLLSRLMFLQFYPQMIRRYFFTFKLVRIASRLILRTHFEEQMKLSLLLVNHNVMKTYGGVKL